MNTGALLIMISSLTAGAQVIECTAIGKDIYSNNAKQRYYEAETSFVLDLESETFKYQSHYFMTEGKFCGWPFPGDFSEGRLDRVDTRTYKIIQSNISGVLTLKDEILTYSGPANEFQLNCVTKKESEIL